MFDFVSDNDDNQFRCHVDGYISRVNNDMCSDQHINYM